jgi:hypothetical protein
MATPVFVPSHAAVQNTVSAHPVGSMELFMLACNIEIDMKLDKRLAESGYTPVVSPSPEPIVAVVSSPVASSPFAAAAAAVANANKKESQYQFSVPLVLNASLPVAMDIDEKSY